MRSKVKKGDIVARISYGEDILFVVERIIRRYSDSKRASNKNRSR